MANTHITLVNELKNFILNETPNMKMITAIDEIAEKARKGYYHDFATPIATPKIELVNDLRAAGLEAFAQRVIDGYYDDESPKDTILA